MRSGNFPSVISRRSENPLRFALPVSVVATFVCATTAYAQVDSGYTYTTLVNFGSGTATGFYPSSGVTLGNDGNLYETTQSGGSTASSSELADGTLYRYNPTSNTTTTLVNFRTGTATGYSPFAGVTVGNDGNLYGTTVYGPDFGGTIYRYNISNNSYTPLINFGSNPVQGDPDQLNGISVYAGLRLSSDGSLYGTTYGGGSADRGTLYRYNPTINMVTTLADFGAGALSGIDPITGVTFSSDGNLYGTTSGGGSSNNSDGTLYRYNIATGTSTTLVSFGFGYTPFESGVTFGSDGNLYGTTYWGGDGVADNSNGGGGTLYRYNLKTGTTTTLVNFGTHTAPGTLPRGGVTLGNDGNLYGTTSFGGSSDSGTLYRYNIATNTYTTLVNFGAGIVTGSHPGADVTFGSDGSLYGTTYSGGSGVDGIGRSAGTVYRLTPNTSVAPEASPLVLLALGGLVGGVVVLRRRRAA